jgi:hypothetical protein
MNDIVKFGNANLPSVQTLAIQLRGLTEASNGGGGGAVILKMDKTGHWVFGADQTEVERDAKWAVNPYSFIHGWIAWGDGAVLGEKMVGVAEPVPPQGEAPFGAARGWERQVGFSLVCTSGEDKGLEARFSATSVGGKKAVTELAVELARHVDSDPQSPVPVVGLSSDFYMHKSYGRIFTPVFTIHGWAALSGVAGSEEEYEEEDEPAPVAPARKTRR